MLCSLMSADVLSSHWTCMKTYDLDPAHYYTAPGLAWDAALKYTDVNLDTITDIDLHLFIERAIRGGISMITHRHAKADNPLLGDYNPAQPTSFILYLDVSNLYGWAMSQPLPLCDFEWIQDPISLNLLEVPDDNSG